MSHLSLAYALVTALNHMKHHNKEFFVSFKLLSQVDYFLFLFFWCLKVKVWFIEADPHYSLIRETLMLLKWMFCNKIMHKILEKKNEVYLYQRESLSKGSNLLTSYHTFLQTTFCLIGNLKINWRQGYEPPNSDRKEGVLRRKRLEYLDCISQYYDIPDSERSDDEVNMLRQVFSDLIRSYLDYSWK